MKAAVEQRLALDESYFVIVLVAGIGMFLTTLDSGILNVAISSLVQAFHSSVTTVAWTISLYSIVICGCIVVFGRLSDRYGRLKIYSAGLALFAIASLLCALSTTVMHLILFRILQGVAAAMLQATSVALITTSVSPNKKGEALGALASFFSLGHLLGPAAGGLILSTVGWKCLFLINIPICLLCLLACQYVLKGKEAPIHKHQPLNLSGSLLLSVSIFSLVYGCSQLGSLHRNTYLYILIFAVLMFLFIRREQRASNPVVALSLFRNGFFAVSLYSIIAYGGVTRLCMVVIPYYLEQGRGYVPWQSGLVNLLLPFGMVLTSNIAGRLMKVWGTLRLMTVGLCCMLLPLVILIFLSNLSLSIVCFMLFVYGLGAGLYQPSNIAAVMEAVGPAHQATIGSVQRLAQNVGISLFTAVTAGFLQSSTHDIWIGSHDSFYLAASVTIISVLGFLGVKQTRKQNNAKSQY